MALVSKNPQRQAGKVELLPGLKLWRVVDVTAEDYKGYDVDARVVLDGDRFTATEVRVRQRPGGPPVNGEALRQVALTGFITNAIGANTTLPPRMPGETYTVIAWGLLEPDDVERMRAAGPTDETLGWVAKVYTLALATGDRPTKAVKEVFELAQSTAGQWVARARERGFLGPAEPGKAG